MAIDPAKREAFRGALQKMIDDGVPEEVIQEATAKFKAKYDTQQTAAMDAEPIESPPAKPVTPNQYLPVDPGGAALNYLAKPALKFAGNIAQSLSTGPINAVAQAVQDKEGVGPVAWQATKNLVKSTLNPFIPGPNPIQSSETTLERAGVPNVPSQVRVPLPSASGGGMGYLPPGFGPEAGPEDPSYTVTMPGAAEVGGTVADMATPMVGLQAVKLAGLAARAALESKFLGKTLEGAGKAIGAGKNLTLDLASATTDIPKEALEMASTKEGRAAFQAMYGREFQVGGQFLDKIDNFKEESIPELKLLDEALAEKGLPISTESMAQAGEAARPAAIEGLGLDPAAIRVAERVEPWINFVRGGPIPEDLAQGAARARNTAQTARAEALAASTQASKDAKLAGQATRAQAVAQSKAAKGASKVGAAKRDAQEAFYSWDRRDANAQIPKVLTEARDAASKAKDAATEARAKMAIGEVSQEEADRALRISENAQRNFEVAEAALRIHKGEKIGEVAREFSSRGIGKDELREILARAKSKSAANPKKEPVILSAVEYRKLRTKLDRQIPFEDEDVNAIKDVFMAMRTKGKEELSAMAKRAGIEGYDKWMDAVTYKLGRLDDFKALAGSSKESRGRRIESLIKNAMGGANPEYKQQLFRDMDEIMGADFSKDIKTMSLSRKLGPEGKAPWLPPQHNGSFMKALAYLKGIGAAGIGSPKVVTHVTIPFLNYLETSLKAGKIKVSPKAISALSALKKPISETQKVRLVNILAAELEAQAPSNTIPFQPQKVAEEDDDSTTLSMRTE